MATAPKREISNYSRQTDDPTRCYTNTVNSVTNLGRRSHPNHRVTQNGMIARACLQETCGAECRRSRSPSFAHLLGQIGEIELL